MAPQLSSDGDVAILDLGDGENRFDPDWVDAVAAALDEVEARPEPRALVVGARGKVWSNGLDLDWMGANTDQVPSLVGRVQSLFARALELGVPTVGALGGHTFAAGAMLALALDTRVMRADRGFFCLPEVDIRIPFTPGMAALVQARLSKATAHEAMTTGRRYGGRDALAAGIVAEALDEGDVLPRAIARARELAPKHGATLATIKRRMYGDVLAALRDPGSDPLATG